MVPFAMSIREAGSSALKTFKGIAADDMHNIQTHVPYLEWLASLLCFKIILAQFVLNWVLVCLFVYNMCACIHVQTKIGLKQYHLSCSHYRILHTSPAATFVSFTSSGLKFSFLVLFFQGRVHSYQLVDIESSQRSPVPFGVLTPPPSSEKPESTVS